MAQFPKRAEFKPLTYEAFEVGEEFVSNEHLVTPGDVETYAFAVDDDRPWFTGDSPFGGPVAPPTMMANQALHLRHTKQYQDKGVTRVMVEVWCENQRGEKTLIGTASRVLD